MDDLSMTDNDTFVFLGNGTGGILRTGVRRIPPYALIQLVFSCIGILGNILSLLVFNRTTFSHLSLSVFLRMLAALDISLLLVFNIATAEAYIRRPRPGTVADHRFHPVAQWFTTSLATASAWMIVAVSSERVTAVFSPLYVKIIFTKKRAIITAVISIPVFFGMNIPTLILEPVPHGVFPLPEYFAVIYSLIPSSIIVVCNALLLWKMRARKMAGNRPEEYRGITLMLIVTSLGFVLLTLPYPLYELTDQNLRSGARIANILILVTGVNHMINFVFYGISGTTFRRELKLMLCRKCIKEKASSTNLRTRVVEATSHYRSVRNSTETIPDTSSRLSSSVQIRVSGLNIKPDDISNKSQDVGRDIRTAGNHAVSVQRKNIRPMPPGILPNNHVPIVIRCTSF